MLLYIHLPFCRSKCQYCDFPSWAGCEDLIPAYIDALLAEAEHAASALRQAEMETVFLGGGTPSIVPAPELARLIRGIGSIFPVAQEAEFTSEANPGTLSEAWLHAAVSGGVNRLSLGMQAAQKELLYTLGRIHTFSQVEQSVMMAHAAGIRNVNLDLMFGLPNQTPAMWDDTLQAALGLHPTHLSCYGLIPEEGTPLTAKLERGELALPEEETERQMYDACLRTLSERGFEQYEISNFALPGFACRHNLGYWRQLHYLGLGVSAASMLPPDMDVQCAYVRRTNPSSLQAYLEMVRGGLWHMRTYEHISAEEARFETMMLGLRTTAGVNESDFVRMHHLTLDECYGKKLRMLERDGLLRHHEGWWSLTRRGMDLQNTALVLLMDDETI